MSSRIIDVSFEGDSSFTSEQVKQLIEQINEQVGDGISLVVDVSEPPLQPPERPPVREVREGNDSGDTALVLFLGGVLFGTVFAGVVYNLCFS